MGRLATVVGVVLSRAGRLSGGTSFNNIMDVLQLVFAFINAPLFATFLLGMFWRRATGHGAFVGLLAGHAGGGVHHGLTLPAHAAAGSRAAGWAVLHSYPSEMAQNFWTAIFAWTACFLVTILVSLASSAPRSDLTGLVYSQTPRLVVKNEPWYGRPAVLGVLALLAVVILNIVFR